MKTNLFKVKEINKEKIVVEEEQLKHPFLFFLKKHQKLLVLLLTLLGVTTIGVGLGLTISLIGNTTDFDISYISGSETISTNPSDDDEVEKELLGNIAITDGVVLVTKKFMTENGDIVTYYSDGTALIVTSDGTIKRVVPLADGSYAIDGNGNIDSNTIRKTVTATTNVLDDGTIITYYSDGSAEITKDKVTIFIRNSDNIKFDLTTTNQVFDLVDPSGVSLATKSNTATNTYKYTQFFDGSVLIEKDGVKYIVHNADDVNLTEGGFNFPNNNAQTILTTQTLSDGNTIEYYKDGSAVIIDSSNNKIVVRKSGDIVIQNDVIYEIVPNDIAYAATTVTTPDGKKVTYYDNGAAVIEKTDGTKEYIEDSSLIKYDTNGNIKSISEDKFSQTVQAALPDGTKVTNFDNGKSQVIEADGTNYIIDTADLTYDISGNIITSQPTSKTETSKTTSTSSTSKTSSNTSATSKTSTADSNTSIEIDIDMTEPENEWNYSKSLESSSFIITSKSKYSRKFRIVIEEVKNYSKFNVVSIKTNEHEAAYYVKYQATFGNNIISATRLSDSKDTTITSTNTYVIYEGTLGAKAELTANIILYIDYEPLDNSFQDKAFVGTIKLYYIESTS